MERSFMQMDLDWELQLIRFDIMISFTIPDNFVNPSIVDIRKLTGDNIAK